jgi:carbohydrate diacid regulator
MSSRLFQSVILKMSVAVGREMGALDADGLVIVCSQPKRIGEKRDDVTSGIGLGSGLIAYNGYSYKVLDVKNGQTEYVVFVAGEDEVARSYCSMLAVALNSIKQLYDEKYDKTTFIKNIIMDNILIGDIYAKSKELHFENEIPRAVMVIHTAEKDERLMETIRSMYPDEQKSFVIAIDDRVTALVTETDGHIGATELLVWAAEIEKAAEARPGKMTIGIGTVANNLMELANAYKEAQVAIEVGKVFDTEKTIVHYEHLGIARLIYQLPTTLCQIFLREVFKKGSIDDLDQETLLTIQKFFENNLNVSETSRKLFVHRNTLVYRLEKIKKIIGLDLREFDHAIVFKVALMVKKYLDSNNPTI